MALYKNNVVTTYANTDTNVPDTAPNRYQTLTGTVVSDGIFVVGTGTLFTSEIGGGLGNLGTGTVITPRRSWLFNGTDELRRIVDVVDDTNLVLEEAFTVDLAGAAVMLVPESKAFQMSYLALAAGGIVDGITLVDGERGGWGETTKPDVMVDPIIIDSTGGSVRVSVYYFN
jgi:hypothetical protein